MELRERQPFNEEEYKKREQLVLNERYHSLGLTLPLMKKPLLIKMLKSMSSECMVREGAFNLSRYKGYLLEE